MLYHNTEIASSNNLLQICLQWVSILSSCQTVKWLQPVKIYSFESWSTGYVLVMPNGDMVSVNAPTDVLMGNIGGPLCIH